jgi:hypothetical protein
MKKTHAFKVTKVNKPVTWLNFLEMSSIIKRQLSCHLVNFPGWRTNRKIVVIESDDWGSIRMPSKEAYRFLIKAGAISANDPFARNDSLASEEDLAALFETLRGFRDFKGNHPVITANCVVANPDFEKIRCSGFSEYHYELFTETLKKYPKHKNAFTLWKEGIGEKLFFPQYHGREHINVNLWLDKLQSGSEAFLNAFDQHTFAADHKVAAAFGIRSEKEIDTIKQIIQEGYDLFSEIFGYSSATFIAPNYTWDKNVEEVMAHNGVKIIQGSKRQNIPDLKKGGTKKAYHYTGQKNRFNQTYLVRNCLFEPSISPKADYVGACLRHIANAFFWNTPAIIGTHRLNYIGSLDEKNRRENLKQLKIVLETILKKWPDAEFLSSAELGQVILHAKND